jgi:hypothetical protein
MLYGTQRSWFVRPERRCKDVLGFKLESRQRIADHVRTIETSVFQLLRY